MTRPVSAATLLYDRRGDTTYILLVHPSGNYNRHAPWSLPKGLPEPGEELEAAARRETLEETGVRAGDLAAIGHIDYRRSRKRIHAFAGALPADAKPRCASWEVDRAELVPLARAREILHPDQRAFLDRIADLIGEG